MGSVLNVEKLKNKARKLELKDQPVKAIEVYLEIVKELEGAPEMDDELALYNKIGDLYQKVRNVNAAVEMYERAANRYTDTGFPNNAIAMYNKVLRCAPGRNHVYLQLAQLMVQRGFVAEAKKNFVEYAERMSAAGKLDDAFAALKRFADISPENEEIRLMLAEQLKAAARDDEAREQIDKLIAEAESKGDRNRASQMLEKVREVDPEYDVDSAGRAPRPRSEDLVFIPLDDEQETPAQVEAEPLITEPTLVPGGGEEDASVEPGPALEIERASMEVDFDTVASDVEPISGLESSEFDSGAAEGVAPMEIETTDEGSLVGDAEAAVVDSPEGLEVPELDLGAFGDEGVDETAAVVAGDEPADHFESEVGEMLDVGKVERGAGEEEGETEEAGIGAHEVSSELAFLEPPVEPVAADADLLGGEEETLESLGRRVAEEPNDWSAGREYAEALIASGDRQRGLEQLDRVLQGFESERDWMHASAVSETILRLEPNSVTHHQKRVEYAYRSGEKPRLVQAYLDLANALFRSGALERAGAIYERVLEHDPDNQDAKDALATVAPPEPAAGEVSAAAPATPSAAETSGDYVDLGAFILGDEDAKKDTRMRVEHEQPTGDEEHDFEEMLQQFKRGIEENLDDEDSQAHYDLGVAFKEMGLVDEAISEFQKALRSADTRLASAEMLGHCFIDKGQTEVAATVLRRAVDSDPSGDQEKIGLLYWLGRCEEEKNRPTEALQYYQRVFAVDIHFEDVGHRVNTLVKAGG